MFCVKLVYKTWKRRSKPYAPTILVGARRAKIEAVRVMCSPARHHHTPAGFVRMESGSDSVTARRLSNQFTLKMEFKLDYI